MSFKSADSLRIGDVILDDSVSYGRPKRRIVGEVMRHDKMSRNNVAPNKIHLFVGGSATIWVCDAGQEFEVT